MGIDKKQDAPDPKTDLNPLAPGVWITEATGFAAVPPRAQSDLSSVRDDSDCTPKEADQTKADDKAEPRIERYRDR